jgi:large subunit ribosomal protein L16
MRGTKTRGNEICFGSYGLQALEPTWITSRQIEASRRAITRTNVELHYGLEFS